MQRIPLSQGKFAIIDDEDVTLLSQFRWCYRGERNKSGYAVRHVKVNGKDRLLYLHRRLMKPKDGQTVIFLNHDTLDCRRANLRAVSTEEARRHHRVPSNSKSGVKGVSHNEEFGTWTAVVYRYGHCYTIGTYGTKEMAVAAYENELSKENPDLTNAPERIERSSNPAPCQQSNPDVN